jgi:hypothetical protein
MGQGARGGNMNYFSVFHLGEWSISHGIPRLGRIGRRENFLLEETGHAKFDYDTLEYELS